MKKRYYNETTREWYTQGNSLTRRVDGTLFSGVPSVEQLTQWGFVEWIDPEPTPEQLLESGKQEKIAELLAYDSSEAVNSFELRQGGVKMTDYWLPRDLRTSLDGDVRACQASGHATYNFDIRELGVTLPLDCAKFLAALTTLREYAYTAYNVTSQHMAAIGRLATVDAVNEYDFTAGYPPKLVFNIEDLV